MTFTRLFTSFSLSFMFCTLGILHSQENSPSTQLTGKVLTLDNQQLSALPFASVRLLLAKDSAFVAGTTTNDKGGYELKVPIAKECLVMVSCMGYESICQAVKRTEGGSLFSLADIVLSEKSIKLKETVVLGKRAEMVVKTDTVEYNAAAYRLQANAVAEDLLKRLPGITITEEGKILVNGKEVKKVMVDGKDFFRSNPNLTIKNIPASIMEKLQVIDDKSELSKLTGVNDGEESIAINITIQKDKKRGWLGSNNIGGGQESNGSEGNLMRYTVNSFTARLVEQSQLGIVVNGNNINGMTVGGGGSSIGSGRPGLNSSFSVGVNFSSGNEHDKSPWIINSDVSYGFNERKLHRTSLRQYLMQDSTSYQADTINQVTRDQGMRFSSKIENRALTGWVFSFSPSASFTTNTRQDRGHALLQAGNMGRDSVNSNSYNISSTTPTVNLGGAFTVAHDFDKKGRKFSLSIDSRYASTEGTGQTDALYTYYRNQPSLRVVNRNQQWENNSLNFNNRLYLSYVEPVSATNSFEFVYWVRSNATENIINNFKPDSLTGAYTLLDLPYSRSLNNIAYTQQFTIGYRGVFSKLIYAFGLDCSPSYNRSLSFIQKGATSGLDSTISYFPGLRTFNYAPNAYLTYNIATGKGFRFVYRGRSEAPSISQLDPSRNETDPTNIRFGNPNLLPKFNHWARMTYNSNQSETQHSFQLNLEGNYILNDIVSLTNYDGTTGIKSTSPVNQSGSWSGSGHMQYSQPVGSYFHLNNYTYTAMRNDIGFSSLGIAQGGVPSVQKNVATTFSVKEELGLSYKWEWLYLMSKASYLLNKTTYTGENMLPKDNTALGCYLSAQCNLPLAWSLTSVLDCRRLTGFSVNSRQNELLWNIEISKSMLKNKAGTLSVLFNDILQQQLSVNQVVTSNYVEDQRFNTLKSFVLMVFSYRFNTMGGQK